MWGILILVVAAVLLWPKKPASTSTVSGETPVDDRVVGFDDNWVTGQPFTVLTAEAAAAKAAAASQVQSAKDAITAAQAAAAGLAPGINAPVGDIDQPRIQAIINGVPVEVSGAIYSPSGRQNVTVVLEDTAYGMSFGGWDVSGETDYSAAITQLQERAAQNDPVAIGQLAVMQSLGLF